MEDGPSRPGGAVAQTSPTLGRPPPPVEPLHITEFASERYFEKLSLSSAQHGELHGEGSAATARQPLVQQGPFILPLRGAILPEEEEIAKPVDHKRPEKSRFFGFRSKSHLRPHASSSTGEHPERRPSVTESSRPR